jgi:predicted  nucleic acid-binding Zn-ribbon protein
MNDETKWKPDPIKGGENIEARKAEVIDHLRAAANVAYYHIDQQLEADIADLKRKAGETKGKVVSAISKAEQMPALTVVRKYWQKNDDDLMHHLTDTIMRNGE